MTEPLPLSKNDSAVVFDSLTDQAPLYGFPGNGVFLCLLPKWAYAFAQTGKWKGSHFHANRQAFADLGRSHGQPAIICARYGEKNLARMGPCGLAAYGPKHSCPGGMGWPKACACPHTYPCAPKAPGGYTKIPGAKPAIFSGFFLFSPLGRFSYTRE